MNEERLYFQCECHTPDHLVSFEIQDWSASVDDRRPEDIKVIVHPLLNPNRSFCERVWTAVRYVFGKPSLHFDEIILPATELKELDKLIRRACSAAKLRELSKGKWKGGRVV